MLLIQSRLPAAGDQRTRQRANAPRLDGTRRGADTRKNHVADATKLRLTASPPAER